MYFPTLARLDHKPGGGGNSRAATSPLPLGSARGPLYCTSQLRACTCVTRPHLWANLGFTFSLIKTVLEPFLPSVLGAFTGAVLAASECGRGGTRHSAKRPLFSRFSRAAAGSKSGVAALESALLRGAFLHRTSSPWCAQSSQSNLRSQAATPVVPAETRGVHRRCSSHEPLPSSVCSTRCTQITH